MSESTMERLQRCAADNRRLTAQLLAYAEALVNVYEDGGFDGISDEMTHWQIDTCNKYWRTIDEARDFIAAAKGLHDRACQCRHAETDHEPEGECYFCDCRQVLLTS